MNEDDYRAVLGGLNNLIRIYLVRGASEQYQPSGDPDRSDHLTADSLERARKLRRMRDFFEETITGALMGNHGGVMELPPSEIGIINAAKFAVVDGDDKGWTCETCNTKDRDLASIQAAHNSARNHNERYHWHSTSSGTSPTLRRLDP